MNPAQQIQQLVTAALDIPDGAKQGIMIMVQQLPENSKQDLLKVIRSSVAGGIGGIISTFLVGSAIPGVMAGVAFQPRGPYLSSYAPQSISPF